jgi:hypothetical protein
MTAFSEIRGSVYAWQCDGETASLPRRAVDSQLAVHRLYKLSGYHQAQARTCCDLLSAEAVEGLEQMLPLYRVHADAVIGYGNGDFFCVTLHLDSGPPSGPVVLDGIGQEVQ